MKLSDKIFLFSNQLHRLVCCNNSYNKTFRDTAANASENNPLSVDHYHYFTHDENSGSDTLGVARTFNFIYDNDTKGENRGSYCLEEQHRRTAISEYRGQKDDWEIQKLEAVRVNTRVM